MNGDGTENKIFFSEEEKKNRWETKSNYLPRQPLLGAGCQRDRSAIARNVVRDVVVDLSLLFTEGGEES